MSNRPAGCYAIELRDDLGWDVVDQKKTATAARDVASVFRGFWTHVRVVDPRGRVLPGETRSVAR